METEEGEEGEILEEGVLRTVSDGMARNAGLSDGASEGQTLENGELRTVSGGMAQNAGLSNGASELLASLSSMANWQLVDETRIARLATALHYDGVECWQDLVLAAVSDFPSVRQDHALFDLCKLLCDMATKQKLSLGARSMSATTSCGAFQGCFVGRREAPASSTRDESPVRSRSPVPMGNVGRSLDTTDGVLGLFKLASTSDGKLCVQQGLLSGSRPELEGLGSSLKPAQANAALKLAVSRGMCPMQFLQRARVETVIGSAPTRIGASASALRCWAAFADAILLTRGKHLPPTLDGLIAFSCIFAVRGTFTNYLAGIRLGCDIAGVQYGDLFNHPLVHRAKQAVGKRMQPARPKRFISLSITEKLCVLACSEDDVTSQMMYILSYAFMLRVRSEGFGLTVGDSDLALSNGQHSAFSVIDGQCKYRLAKRKNLPRGSLLVRKCWCHRSSATCPVHVLGSWLLAKGVGAQPFLGQSGSRAIVELRRRLAVLGIPCASEFVLQDFRRGHAQDLLLAGARLNVILAAGQWRSSAFLKYIDTAELEARAVLEAHFAESEAEDDP